LHVDSIKSSQSLVAEKLLQISQIHNPHSGNKKNSQKIIEDDPSEEWQKRKDKLLTKEERMLVERFKAAVDYHKNITTTNKNKLKLV